MVHCGLAHDRTEKWSVRQNAPSPSGLRGSYQTAWAMLHRFRGAIGHTEHERLSGDVEVDETLIGGVRPGKRGRGAAGKALVAVAVEQAHPKGSGRCRIQVIPNAESDTLRSFLLRHIEPGSTILTDGLASYPGAAGSDYIHHSTPIKGSGMEAHELLPGVHRVASLVKRWLLGTHQGSIGADHMQAYLDEFTFRFNRRGSRARGSSSTDSSSSRWECAPSLPMTLWPTQNPEKMDKIDPRRPTRGGQRLHRFARKHHQSMATLINRICMDTPL